MSEKETIEKIANIYNSIWVSASAGSGKTTILVKRLLSLILNDVDISKIVCITYTKTGAQEMKERVLKSLSSWAISSDRELENIIEETIGIKATQKNMKKARILFAKVLDNMDNLRIFTIHSFCQQIISRFPIEAGIMPNFRIIDEYQSESLIKITIEDLILNSIDNSNTYKSLKLLISEKNEDDFYDFINKLISKRKNLEILREIDYENELKKQFNIFANDMTEILEEFISKDHSDIIRFYKEIENIEITEKQKEDYARIPILINDREKIDEYINIFLTNEFKKRKITDALARKLDNYDKSLKEILMEEQNRCYEYVQNIRNLECFNLTLATIDIGFKIIDNYRQLKFKQGILDFDDLITITLKLLQNTEYSAWINYKLDNGIEHILVDEAQDTSALQWRIVECLTNEFFVGEGSKENPRSIFIVGDEKQSIFKFQDANPQMFNKMYNFYKNLISNSRNSFYKINLDYSFRSVSTILNFVDTVFQNYSYKISSIDRNIKHNNIRSGIGLVELWPLIDVEKNSEKPWSFNFDNDVETEKQELLAKYIVNKIIELTSSDRAIVDRNGKNQRITFGDIMILVKNRNPVFLSYLIRNLNSNKIPNSGLDRIDLFENLVIKDIISLLTFITFQDDDLSLANIVKSPILSLTEDDLYKLCRHKTENKISLFEAMKKINRDSYEFLTKIIEKGKNSGIYELCFYIMEDCGVKNYILSRFGYDTNDILDKFMTFVWNYESDGNYSILSLLHFIKNNKKNKIKKDLESNNINQVRIMTIHASKGLQAPIVFIIDINSGINCKEEKILWNKNRHDYEIPFYKTNTDSESEITNKIKEENKDELHSEYFRLLYVALTRAENELYLCGLKNKSENQENSLENIDSNRSTWFNLVKEAMTKLNAKEVNFEYNREEKKIVYGNSLTDENIRNIEINSNSESDTEAVEKIFKNIKKYKPNILPRKIISPSQFFNYSNRDDIYSSTENICILKGSAVHKLLEVLPKTSRENWDEISKLYLENTFSELPEKEKTLVKKNVFNILTNDKFSLFFSENSRSEVGIVGEVDTFIVSGKVDRLVESDEKILILDYKNTTKNYKNKNELPKEYIKQIELYEKLVRRLYINKPIESYILLTTFGELIRIN